MMQVGGFRYEGDPGSYHPAIEEISAEVIVEVRAADVERGPSEAEIDDAARHLWDELPGEAYHDYEVGHVALVWDEARHESQVTYRGVTTDILQTAAKVRAEEVR